MRPELSEERGPCTALLPCLCPRKGLSLPTATPQSCWVHLSPHPGQWLFLVRSPGPQPMECGCFTDRKQHFSTFGPVMAQQFCKDEERGLK